MPEDEYNDNLSFCMDMFGYSYYISLLISPLPGFLIAIIKKFSSGPKGIMVDISWTEPGVPARDVAWADVVLEDLVRFHLVPTG